MTNIKKKKKKKLLAVEFMSFE